MDLEAYEPGLALEAFGLNNTGALCHLNALLQALVGNTCVTRAVFAARPYLARTATGRALHDFVDSAAAAGRRREIRGHRPRTPRGARFGPPRAVAEMSAVVLACLVANLRKRRPSVRYGPAQESASEGLVLLLDMLDDPAGFGASGVAGEARVSESENPVARLFYHRFEITTTCGACGAATAAARDVAVQLNMFFYDDAPPATPAAFGAAVQAHRSVASSYACERCGARGDAVRRHRLRMVPEVLVCLFNVYAERRARYFPERFTLEGAAGAHLLFRQTAQVEHVGGLGGGHYYARALRADPGAAGAPDAGAADAAGAAGAPGAAGAAGAAGESFEAKTDAGTAAPPEEGGAEAIGGEGAGGGDADPLGVFLLNDMSVSRTAFGPSPETYLVFYQYAGLVAEPL